jgi:hypothetical protein
MDIDKYYAPLISDLKQGKRVFFKASKPVLRELAEYFSHLLENPNQQELRKVLCLLDHCQFPCPYFVSPLYQALEQETDPDNLIFLLSCFSNHVVKLAIDGQHRIEKGYYKFLQALLSHKSPEVLEWTLRIIDQLPKVPAELKAAVLQKKPSILKIGNKHYKAARQIVGMLEKRWQHEPRRPS